MSLVVSVTSESHGDCDCCGNRTRTVWGEVLDADEAVAVYFVQWTVGAPSHWPNFDLIIGELGRACECRRSGLGGASLPCGDAGWWLHGSRPPAIALRRRANCMALHCGGMT